ncbi:MAG: VTT domain-containing protein [bacterium]
MKAYRTYLLASVVFVAIGVSFYLYGPAIDAWTMRLVNQAYAHPWRAGLLLVALLASDIVLPIPSSLASVACGLALGFWGGMLASFAGMMISTVLGYALGYVASPATTKLIGKNEQEQMRAFYGRFGLWMLLALRPVPMFAEMSVLFSGLARESFPKVLWVTALGNLTVSVVYAAIGAWGKLTDSFFPAFAASIAVSGLMLLICKKRVK